MNLPRGIWYEESRRRYRVRLYHRQQVIWLTYHVTLDDALSARDQALAFQNTWRPTTPVVRVPYPQKIMDLFA